MRTTDDRGEGRRTEEDGDQEEPFVARWSRRKRESVAVDEPEVAAERDAPPEEEREAPPALTDEDMPPVESITEDTDVSGFLSAGVSETLRREALRRLFSMPKFQVKDGLDDYDGEYRSFTPLGDTITSDMKLQAERRQARAKEEAEREGGPATAGPADGAEPQPGIDGDGGEQEQSIAAAEPRSDGEADGD